MKIEINAMSLAQLVASINAVGVLQSGDAYKEVKSVQSKSKGVERLEALIGDDALDFDFAEDGSVTVSEAEVDLTEGEELEELDEGDVGLSEKAADEAVAAMPFVKASKEELAAMDGATRAAYRKNRRKAARTARKARSAAPAAPAAPPADEADATDPLVEDGEAVETPAEDLPQVETESLEG